MTSSSGSEMIELKSSALGPSSKQQSAPLSSSSSSSSSSQVHLEKKQYRNKKNGGTSHNANKERKYDHKNDSELTQLELQLRQGKKVNGSSRRNQISINHLLDFQSYEDSDEYNQKKQKNRSRRGSSNQKQRVLPPKLQLTGMKFINVNFKFVVDSRQSYRKQELDPNIPVDTENIISIIAPKSSCPICLSSDLVAPRMIISCGHIMCLKCVLSMLEHEVPKAKKKESAAVIEKYRECPLCFSIIRKSELKPVIVDDVDERFEVPKVHDEVVLTLMARDPQRTLSLPKLLRDTTHIEDFPNARDADLAPYSKIFKGDYQYLVELYEKEKENIVASHKKEMSLYGDETALVQRTLTHIDNEISSWTSKFATPPSKDAKPQKNENSTHHHHQHNQSFYYYETGFRASCTYVLSPLDMKVLKHTYERYENLPSSVVAKIENIRYEELTSATSMTKYKYLSHLPAGTQIGFLECFWENHQCVSPETWSTFKDDLVKRTQQSSKKFRKEERDKKRAENDAETELKNFYNDAMGSEKFEAMSIADIPLLPRSTTTTNNNNNNNNNNDDDTEAVDLQTTVWGTKIPKSNINENVPSGEDYDNNDDWGNADEFIREAKEKMMTMGRKKKNKKLVLLTL
ncbi:hypothetical protein KGF56_003820 [Candida oxycetoniae]|uniref:RING-type domain-containing protein n=1 Tax=Candida oxycetoniae TaxID=497107 RepID=A0AAI9WWX6_9ASCO|nr:uncharacterized protein KGF56_003820 [Candida oxycetoniae]KAI3403399.2 hypothetical protein KGF56_003820 [Candida oxycetoniae]